MAFAERVDADRRRLILRTLAENGGSASESVIEQTLVELGERLGVDRRYVRDQLRFLERADIVSIELYRDAMMVATITLHGGVVLEGRINVDGVARRKLGEPTTLAG